MKTVMMITIVLLSANAFGQTSNKVSKTETAVLKVMDEQVTAWNRGDIDGFMQGYWKSDDMRFVSGNTVSKGWQAALDRYKSSYTSREIMGTLSFSEIETTRLSKKAFLVKGRFTLKRKTDEPTGLFTLVFRKIDGAWKIVHDHTST